MHIVQRVKCLFSHCAFLFYAGNGGKRIITKRSSSRKGRCCTQAVKRIPSMVSTCSANTLPVRGGLDQSNICAHTRDRLGLFSYTLGTRSRGDERRLCRFCFFSSCKSPRLSSVIIRIVFVFEPLKSLLNAVSGEFSNRLTFPAVPYCCSVDTGPTCKGMCPGLFLQHSPLQILDSPHFSCWHKNPV